MTLICCTGEGLHFSFPSRIHCQRPVKRWKNLDRSLKSMSSWNEEACVHVDQGQVAACGLGSKGTGEVAHLRPGETWGCWGKPDPCHGSPAIAALGRHFRGKGGHHLGGWGRQEREGFLRIGFKEEDGGWQVSLKSNAWLALPPRKGWSSTQLTQEAASLLQGSRVGWGCLLGLSLLLPTFLAGKYS